MKKLVLALLVMVALPVWAVDTSVIVDVNWFQATYGDDPGAQLYDPADPMYETAYTDDDEEVPGEGLFGEVSCAVCLTQDLGEGLVGTAKVAVSEMSDGVDTYSATLVEEFKIAKSGAFGQDGR